MNMNMNKDYNRLEACGRLFNQAARKVVRFKPAKAGDLLEEIQPNVIKFNALEAVEKSFKAMTITPDD